MTSQQLRERLRMDGYTLSNPVCSEPSGLWMIEIRRGLVPSAVVRLDTNPEHERARFCAVHFPTLARIERLAHPEECGLVRGLRRVLELEPELLSAEANARTQSPRLSG